MDTMNFEISAFIMSLLCVAYGLSVKRRQYTVPKGFENKMLSQHFMFLMLVLSNMLAAAASVVGTFLLEVDLDGIDVLRYIFHALYFIFHSTLPAAFALYIMNVNGTSVGRKRSFYILFSLPYVLSEILVLTNSFTKLVFYMDPETGYNRGPLMVLLYAFAAIYMIWGTVSFFKYKKAVNRVDSIVIGLVILIAMIGVVVQAAFPKIIIELFFESLAFIVLMMLLEEKSGSIDIVTGAFNRVAFADANRRLMETHKKYKLILLKLTDLEMYSKLFGGRDIDEIRMKISSWLSSIVPATEVFSFRFNDFGIVSTSETSEQVDNIVKEILKRFESEWTSRDVSIELKVLVTIVNVPDDISTLADLEDMLSGGYKSKTVGSRFVPYEEVAKFQHSKTLERVLRNAVKDHKLDVYYQPIHSMESGRTVSAEALLRVNDENMKNISPEIYIPIAEKSGLIREIGDYVFERVCKLLKNETVRSSEIQYVELNLSIYQFMYEDMVKRFEEIRESNGIDVTSMNLEITESASSNEAPAVVETMNKLRELGYTFSLDDFGTGYSNIVRLISGEYKNVKLDKSLLWDSDNNEAAGVLLDSLIKIIKGLGYNVIQEGVETKEQLDRVMSSGCNMIQGFYFGKPMPEKEFLEYLIAEGRSNEN